MGDSSRRAEVSIAQQGLQEKILSSHQSAAAAASGARLSTEASELACPVHVTTTVAGDAQGQATPLPGKRKIPDFPSGHISQQEGEAFCKIICDTFPEVFDG